MNSPNFFGSIGNPLSADKPFSRKDHKDNKDRKDSNDGNGRKGCGAAPKKNRRRLKKSD
ncbi:MAG: hypothetical protein NTX50_27730 [Candidatus Sumerlaeota bacterium]|nr:hypothetical protein [Candidatus Sumerlaeota bacterium]